MKNIITFLSKYKHAWLLCYGFIYLPWFCYLEKTVTRHYHVMHVALDDFIPFNEYFIIPYMMWFLYVAGTIVFFLFRNKEDYYRICTFLFSGMTISLIICTFFHNGTDFRPAFAYVNELLEQGVLKNLGGLLYFTDGKGIYPKKRPEYKTAFLFLDDYDESAVPPWAMRLRVEQEDILAEETRRNHEH